MIAGFSTNQVVADQDAQKVVASEGHATVDLDEECLHADAQVYVLDKPIRDALDTEIRPVLAKGFVKPLFHALFLPKFLHNFHLSPTVVEDGGVDENRTLKFGIYAENLDKAVEEVHGKGAATINDTGMETPWEFDSAQVNFAVELVNTDAEMLGEGIECTTLKSIPIEINSEDESTHSYELLTRPESRGVVSDIFRRFAKEADDGGSVAAITGSPGIGKSWTLFYALQQALLYDGATVLFFFQKLDKAVMYLRRNNKIYAWTSTSRLYANSNLFRRVDVLVLLDPTDATEGGARFNLGRMKLLYAASNNDDHFKNAAAKNNGGMRAILGPPLDSEMNVILARLDPNLEQGVIKKRKEEVGNLIRCVLDESHYQKRVGIIRANLKRCAKDSTKLEHALLVNGMSNGKDTVPGTLFQMLPRRPDDLSAIGYDGQNVEYRKRVILAVNESVRNAILKAGRKAMLSYWGKVSGDECARMGGAKGNLYQ